LCLQGAAPEFRLHMAAEDDGWFGITTELAGSDFYYQYLINGTHYVPDPASRYQPWDVHGSSQVVDPSAYRWQDRDWQPGPWEEAVIYELHVGTFSPEGTFAGVKNRLDYLADLGVTAIQLMPVAEFAGQRNWGYDGVLPFAPDSSYGTPDDLKNLIAAAHGKGLMVFNDVVYNHFGPEGNYLRQYAPNFFTHRFITPWGDAFNFSGSRWVRQYFIHNALYWLEEYHFDGLRLDAAHAIFDDNSPDILEELAETVRQWPGYDRRVYLMLENDHNVPQYLRPDPAHSQRFFDAQWNDDLHHALHVLLTGETFGYYRDYRQQPMRHLGRCLSEGFAYQGEKSSYRQGRPRGKPSSDLPPTSFISFLQNHDMVGNRPLGERITELSIPEAVRAATALLLLAPFPPLLFMGQEWACSSPFPYFVDFPEELARQVAEGRLREFSGFPAFADAEVLSRMPLPDAPQTFQSAKLFWEEIELPHHRHWLEFHRELLRIRKREIIPRMRGIGGGQAGFRLLGDRAIHVRWRLNDGSVLLLNANLGREPVYLDHPPEGQILYDSADDPAQEFRLGRLHPWTVLIYLEGP
jgi:1,4-alpha-glucan branching enzyme/maltooligosyltrehalose trehalohydrolase